MTNFNALQNNLEALSLTKMKEILPGVIEKSIKTGATLQDSLTELTEAEIGRLYGVSQQSISKRLARICKKIKNLMNI